MKRNRRGFTMIEMVFVILIGSILTSIALSSFRNVQARMAVQGAKQVYMTWHQRARSRAIETGETVVMIVDVPGNSAQLFTVIGGTPQWADVQRFDDELGVDLRTAGNTVFQLCMTPRGFADHNCGALEQFGAGMQQTYTGVVRLEFWLDADSASVLILPLGQLVG